MKTFFTLFAAFLMSTAVFAAAKPKSVLTIQSADKADIRIVVDGKRFEPNDNALVIRGIDEGNHSVKVFRERKNGFFNLSGRGYELVYNSVVNVKKRTHLSITIQRNGRATMEESRIRGNGNNGRDYDYDRDGQWGDYDHNEGYAGTMNDREFRAVLQSIDKEWLESNKLKSASQIIRTNSFTTAQVEQMLLLFSFENNKLELAKQAYGNTIDKRNYSRLMDVFSFNSSKAELERYIRSYR